MNPLLSRHFRIPFDRIEPHHVEPAIREAVSRAKAEIAGIAGSNGPRSYENTVDALDEAVERVDRVVTVARHMVAVADTPALREAFNQALPVFSEFYAQLPTSPELWAALKEYGESTEARSLSGVRRRRLEKLLKEFQRAGAELPPEKRRRVEEIRMELSKLHTRFAENVLDATNAFELVLTDERDLAGLPESARRQARAAAEARGIEGWRFTLHQPSYVPFMQYADDRALRRRMYDAFFSRADSGETDNRPLIREILALRRELATILGYRDFADYRLELNMVGSGEAAVDFEQELFERTLPFWRSEMEELEHFARAELGLERIEPWDLAYAAEKLRKKRFDLDSEELRPYFPLDGVLRGLFEISRRLFGVEVRELENDAVWHPDVRYYELRDERGAHIGSFYLDPFPRDSKRAGAWMNPLLTGGPREDGGWEPHLALIAANFTPPEGGRPALLTHREVETTFHEFGHMLHHLLSRVEVKALAGTNVPWDWVELPSQIMENWTWEREALDLFARHVDTGEPIPAELFSKLQASRTFMEGYAQMRQLSFGTVDLSLHVDYDPASGDDPVEYGNRVMERFVPRPEFAHNSFLCVFQHVFTGSYAAGYYSYKWSEVLEADAFSRFRETGIFDRATGRAFVDAVLSQGDSRDASEMFREFMGRDPDLEALLRRNLGAGMARVAGD